MFKSCDYCRHRKKKCVVPPASTRCTDCQHLDLPCEFSHRAPSLKRRQTSRVNAARVGIASSVTRSDTIDANGSNKSDADDANHKQGDSSPFAGGLNMANKRLLEPFNSTGDRQSSGLSIVGRYWRDVHPFWPFITSDMLEEGGGDPDLRHCIDLACLLSFNSMKELKDIQSHTDRLILTLQQDQPSMALIAGTLLLSFFIRLDDELLEMTFDTVEQWVANAAITTPPSVVSGTLVTNVWRRLAGHSHKPLHLSTDVLHTYGETLDPASFGYHFFRLTRHAAELDQRCRAMEVEGIQPGIPLVWAKLEYEFLLWQVSLPPSLLDARDELPATPESVVIHCFSSLLLLSYYNCVLEYVNTLGVQIALRPVPGVLNFMCALARSTFICPRRLLNHMPLLISIQAQTARIMLRVWHQTGFENCRVILNLWANPDDRFPSLARQIREDIGFGPWAIEEIDGYSVFWTFRDLRTLTTKFIFADRLN